MHLSVTHGGISNKKIISYNLHLFSNLISEFGIGGPVILIKRVFDRDNRVLRNEGLVQIFQTVT